MAKETQLSVQESRELMLNPAYQAMKLFEIQQRMAQMYVQSTIIPDNYRGNIGNCVIAIDMAQRMQANPLMVMQNLTVIYGRPSWSSKFLIATVNTCGRFEPLQYKFEDLGILGKVEYIDYVYNPNTRQKEAIKKVFDGSKMHNMQCIAFTSPKGNKDVVLESSPITIEIAIKEGWFTKSGSKWQSIPRQMLMYRAASWWTSAYAPEISMGFQTREEVEDLVEGDTYEELKPEELQEAMAAANASVEQVVPAMSTPVAISETATPVTDGRSTKERAKEILARYNMQQQGEAKPQPVDPTDMINEAMNRQHNVVSYESDVDTETGELFNK